MTNTALEAIVRRVAKMKHLIHNFQNCKPRTICDKLLPSKLGRAESGWAEGKCATELTQKRRGMARMQQSNGSYATHTHIYIIQFLFAANSRKSTK